MAAQRRCQTCHRRFTRPVGSSRLNCFVCRPSRASNVMQLPPPADDGLSLTTLTKKALADAGVLATWQGVAALKLAQLIDSGKHGTSGAAQNVKAHREAMAVALAAAAKEADVISLIFRDDASQQLDEPHGGSF
jgi:hypothetical protein